MLITEQIGAESIYTMHTYVHNSTYDQAVAEQSNTPN